jgi:hypothetical protein
MSKLQTALRSGAETLDSLATKYAIKVKPHPRFPNLVQLKYNQIDSPMGDPLVQECRGIIFDTTDWRIVARPFDKFFNQGEGHAAPIDWKTARVQEKLDGSLMILYHHDGAWHVASSGTPDAGGEVNNAPGTTFAQLFWNTWDNHMWYDPADLQPDLTYMFELQTKYNRVVVNHPEPKLVLIGVRNRISGEEYPSSTFDGLFQVVREFPMHTLDQVMASMEHFSGLEQEGYVVVDDHFRRVKIKHPAYLAAHHMVGSLSQKRLLEIVRQGETPEILAYFPEWTVEANALRVKYEDFVTEACIEYQKVRDIPVQKDFALAIKDSRHRSAMFTLRAGKVANLGEFYRGLRLESLCEMLGLKKEEADEQVEV